jgi:hypothetical protein
MATNGTTQPTKTYTINQATTYLGIKSFYLRKLLKSGRIESTKEQIGSTKVYRNMIPQASLDNYLATKKIGFGKREDGRNKYTIYLTEPEFKELTKSFPKALIAKANIKKSK